MDEKTVYCNVRHITYQNEENGFVIFAAEKDFQRFSAKGYLPSVDPGQHLKLTGTWEDDPRYGKQFKFTSAEVVLPTDARGIQKYLSSGIIKGIGPATALNIIKAFGNKAFEVLNKEPERLREIPGIGKSKYDVIMRSWRENQSVNFLMKELAKYEIPPSFILKIYRKYGDEAEKVVKTNPYRLADEIENVGFKTADKIARKIGVALDNPIRLKSGISYVLHKSADVGHCYLDKKTLIDKAKKELGTNSDELIEKAIEESVLNRLIVKEEDRYYLKKYLHEEEDVAMDLFQIFLKHPDVISEHIVSNTLATFSEKFDESQLKAINTAVESKGMILTGGPGTGKTTITKAIIRIFENAGKRVVLASPTGKAAKRLSESTQRDASTIHRLLKYSPGGGFRHNSMNQIYADVFIIDECSMIDISLMKALLDAIPMDSRVIFVGDADQLPSVGPGNVFADMIASNEIPVVRLEQIHRQAEGSAIIKNSGLVNSGEVIDTAKTDDFEFIEEYDPEVVQKKVIELIDDLVKGGVNASDIQVLYPTKKTPKFLNTIELNVALQSVLNPYGKPLNHFDCGTRLRVGDRVMQLKNNYEKEVFNGDCGYITGVDQESGTVLIDFGDGDISYEYVDLDQITLAYACTIHKSQGSEYKTVILPYTSVNPLMKKRNLLYTAISRAKEKLFIVGSLTEIKESARNNRKEERKTTLTKRIKECWEEPEF